MGSPEVHTLGSDFKWYAVAAATDNLEQGDMFFDFPVAEPPPQFPQLFGEIAEGEKLEGEAQVRTYNVILMSQSCDLPKLTPNSHVILCAVYDIRQARLPSGQALGNPDGWNKLRKGQIVFAHLLNKYDIPRHEFDYQVVDLQQVISVPLRTVLEARERHGERVRLLPPYREHLAQAFARQFMRVGLPVDLPQNYPYR